MEHSQNELRFYCETKFRKEISPSRSAIITIIIIKEGQQ